jgi:hypothetical protein
MNTELKNQNIDIVGKNSSFTFWVDGQLFARLEFEDGKISLVTKTA